LERLEDELNLPSRRALRHCRKSMDELPVGVRAAMAMANGNRPTMTAEVVAVEEVQEKSVFVVKVSTAHDSYNSYNVRRRLSMWNRADLLVP
jgi:hypothetical protein